MNEIIKRIKHNLEVLSDLHIVPDWRWDDRLWEKFKRAFPNVDSFRDDHGNVYLNCRSHDDFIQRMMEERVLVLQTHLDHPGGRIIGRSLHEGRWLYAALWKGGYKYSFEGKPLLIRDMCCDVSESVVIERDLKRFGERILYFWSDTVFGSDTYIHFPGTACEIDSAEGVVRSWALDDLMNCAILLDVFRGSIPSNVVALMTLDEEGGGSGIKFFRNMVEERCARRVPVTINLEASAEDEGVHLYSGGGVKIRTADSHAKFTEDISLILQRLFPKLSPLEITSGGTEASRLVKSGWAVGALAIPIRDAHNGSDTGAWIEEEASLNDLLQMHNSVRLLCESSLLFDRIYTKPSNIPPHQKFSVSVDDDAASIIDSIKHSRDYSEYLNEAAIRWNRKQNEYNIPLIHISAAEYARYRDKIDRGVIVPISDETLRYSVKSLYPFVSGSLGLSKNMELSVYVLLSNDFNARRIKDGIAFSLLKLDATDMTRVITHELTHWVTDEALFRNYSRKLERGLISEGLACYVSARIDNIEPYRAINVTESAYKNLRNNDGHLKKRFIRLMKGECVEIQGNRHRLIHDVDAYSPFTISTDNPFNKYGYYLGFGFVSYCLKRGLVVNDLIMRPGRVRKMLHGYLRDDFVI